jgi:hypothetical protein
MAVAISLLSSWEIAIDSPRSGSLKRRRAWIGRGGILHSFCYVDVNTMLINRPAVSAMV